MDLKTATQKAIHYLRDYPDSKSLGKNISEIIQLYIRNVVAYVLKQEDATTQRLYSKIEDLEHQLNLEKDKTKSIQKIHNEFKDNITSKQLDANRVIAWLKDQACLGYIEDIEVDVFVERFKKYFEI